MSAPEAVTLWRGDHYEGDSFFLSESKHQRREKWTALPVAAFDTLEAKASAYPDAMDLIRSLVGEIAAIEAERDGFVKANIALDARLLVTEKQRDEALAKAEGGGK